MRIPVVSVAVELIGLPTSVQIGDHQFMTSFRSTNDKLIIWRWGVSSQTAMWIKRMLSQMIILA